MKRCLIRLLVAMLIVMPALSFGSVAADVHSCCECGKAECAENSHETITFSTALPNTGNNLPSGNYYLAQDLTPERMISIPSGATVNLYLNGSTLTGPNSKNYVIKVNTGGTLNIYDSANGKITGGNPGIANYGTLTLYGGSISGNTNYGVRNYSGASFVMNGGFVSNNTGRGVSNEGGTFTMNGGFITDNTKGGVTNNSTFIMTGGSITGNTNTANGAGVAHNGTSMIISGDAVISGNIGKNAAANNLHLGSSAVVTLTKELGSNASIGITPSSKNGGTVIVSGSGYTLTASDTAKFFHDLGTLSFNLLSAANSVIVGPVYPVVSFNPGEGTVSQSWAMVSSNGFLSAFPTASREGYALLGWFTAADGGEQITSSTKIEQDITVYARWLVAHTITFNAGDGTASEASMYTNGTYQLDELPTATLAGHALTGWYTAAEGGEKITADTVFTQNTTLYARYVPSYTVTFNAGEGTASATTMPTNGSYQLDTLPAAELDEYMFAGWFTAADGGEQITTATVFSQNTTVYAHWADCPSVCQCGKAECSEPGHTRITFNTALPGTGDNLPSGNYFLAQDLTLAKSITIPSDAVVNLYLNGKVLCGPDNSKVIIHISKGGVLNIYDTSAITHTFTEDATGLWVLDEDATGDVHTLIGGIITAGNTGDINTGGYIQNSGTLTLYGGNISGITGIRGGGVVSNNADATFIMRGGSISGNVAQAIYNKGTFILHAGSITGNRGIGDGSIVNNHAIFTMYGGSIENNESTKAGCVWNWDTFTMNGGTISGTNRSGVTNKGAFTMNGGIISGNTAERSGVCIGGGVDNRGDFTMKGGTISDNHTECGGGVYNRGTFTMEGGSIKNNTAETGGGVLNYGTFLLQNGLIFKNEADTCGGGVCNRKDFTMNGGQIYLNRANGTYGKGGGVCNHGIFTMTAGYIFSNTAKKNPTINNSGILTLPDSIQFSSMQDVYVDINGEAISEQEKQAIINEALGNSTVTDVVPDLTVNEDAKNDLIDALPDSVGDKVAAADQAVTVKDVVLMGFRIGKDNIPTNMSYDVTPNLVYGNTKVEIDPDSPITFRLHVPGGVKSPIVTVYHTKEDGTLEFFGTYPVRSENGKKFIEISAQDFSVYSFDTQSGIAEVNTLEGLQAALTADEVVAVVITEEIPVEGNVTIDLNGKTVAAGWKDEANGEHHYALNNTGTLAIKDSVGGGSITARGIRNGYADRNHVVSATLTIESGLFINSDTNGGSVIDNYGQLVINGGTFDAYDGSASVLRNNAGASATINGGIISGHTDSAYAIVSDGTLLITNSKNNVQIFGSGAVCVNGGTATINGGTFIAAQGNALNISGGTVTVTAGTIQSPKLESGAAVNFAAGSLLIRGGTFEGFDDSETIHNKAIQLADNSTGAVHISGGTFTFGIGQVGSSSATVAIHSGTFDTPISAEHCAPGFSSNLNPDGSYSVEAVVPVYTVTFSIPEGAFIAVKKGDKTVMITTEGRLPNGDYTYEVSKAGYDTASGIFTISDANSSHIVVELVKTNYTVIFNVTPSDASIVVKDNSGNPVAAERDGSYKLVPGSYAYTVSKTGYDTKSGTLTVTDAAYTETVTLTETPVVVTTYRAVVAETANGTVTLSHTRASCNSLITITATPDAGYKVAKVAVTNFRGEEVAVTDLGNGNYTFRMPGSTTIVSVTFECDGSNSETCSSSHLVDVDHSQWYHIAVDYAVTNGLMCGIGDGKFAPEAIMDRSMVIQVLYNMEGQPSVQYDNAFGDVSADKWYANAIQWGVNNGIMVGYGTQFVPEGAISREEMVQMMYNYAKYKGKDVSARGDLSKYTDGATTSDWAVECVQWAVGSGVMVGGNTVLNPTGSGNRAEVAQIFKNFHEIYG